MSERPRWRLPGRAGGAARSPAAPSPAARSPALRSPAARSSALRFASGRGWSIGVPVIALTAGLLFTTSANTAQGIPLRDDRRLELTELIEERQLRVTEAEDILAPLETRVEQLTGEMAGGDTPVREQRERSDSYRVAAGFTDVRGPGLTVALDDALRPDGRRPEGADSADLLVHQEDMQAVVNALWEGGAEAMSIMGVRVISTSAVICVGPVLLLHGRPYSPPYVVTAIGDPDELSGSLARSPGVQLFREAADAYGLGYSERVEEDVTVPAFDGTSTLRSGTVPR